jgi:putative ABC transport system substrate-binding protein
MKQAKRRYLLIGMGAGAFAIAYPLFAQPKPHRIGFFYPASRESALDTGRYQAFLKGMRELGYVEGRDFVIEERFISVNDPARLAEAAGQLVKSNLEVIVSSGGASGQALKRATSTVPVVISLTVDMVREGFAASLASPGGNFTGMGAFLDQIFPKHIEVLRLVVPKLSRVMCLADASNSSHPELRKIVEATARQSNVEVLNYACDNVQAIERDISDAAKRRAQGVIILGSTFFVQYFRQIAGMATSHRLASIYSGREYPQAGGSMSYGPDFRDNYRRAAGYVDKILKGAKPAQLPIEQPTKFELVVNRKAIEAIGANLSQELLLRADEVIG